MNESMNNNEETVLKPYKVKVFSTLLSTRPTIVVNSGAKHNIIEALEDNDIEHKAFNIADGQTRATLDREDSILTFKEFPDYFFGIVMLTPAKNSAGAESFSFIRGQAKVDAHFKAYLSAVCSRFNKNNWTRLSTEELNILWSEYSYSKITEEPTETVIEEVVSPVKEELSEDKEILSEEFFNLKDSLLRLISLTKSILDQLETKESQDLDIKAEKLVESEEYLERIMEEFEEEYDDDDEEYDDDYGYDEEDDYYYD